MATRECGLFLLWERSLEIGGFEVGSRTGYNEEGLGGYTQGHAELISFQEPRVRACYGSQRAMSTSRITRV